MWLTLTYSLHHIIYVFLQQRDVQGPVMWTKQVQNVSWSSSDRRIGDNLAGSECIILGPPLSWHDSLGYTNGNRADKRRKREPAKIKSQGLRGCCRSSGFGWMQTFLWHIYPGFLWGIFFAKICNFLRHCFLFILIRSNLGWVSNTSEQNLRFKKFREIVLHSFLWVNFQSPVVWQHLNRIYTSYIH